MGNIDKIEKIVSLQNIFCLAFYFFIMSQVDTIDGKLVERVITPLSLIGFIVKNSI